MKITQKDLDNVVNRLNIVCGTPATEYTKIGDKYTVNLGNYHLEYGNGYIGLSQHVITGGESTIFSGCTKRELYCLIHAFIKGRGEGFNAGYKIGINTENHAERQIS